ncbi:hypothetical protein [Pseudonocardia xishanensis]
MRATRARPALVLATGAAVLGAELAWRAGRPLRTMSAAAARIAGSAADVLVPAELTEELAARGFAATAATRRRVEALVSAVIGRTVEAFLAATDLTALVVEHVELDRVAAGLDVDGVIARVDLDAVLRRVDLDAVMRRVDLDAVATRLDPDRVVARVDLDAVLQRVDLDAVVARLDLDRVVAGVDLDAVVARLDLVGLARGVIDAIDLPGIVRESTGTLTSDTVRGVRSEAQQADEVVARVVDRLLRRSSTRAAVPP